MWLNNSEHSSSVNQYYVTQYYILVGTGFVLFIIRYAQSEVILWVDFEVIRSPDSAFILNIGRI